MYPICKIHHQMEKHVCASVLSHPGMFHEYVSDGRVCHLPGKWDRHK